MAKRKSGLRTKAGRLRGAATREGRQARDYGNDVVVARIGAFDDAAFQGGGHGVHSGDGIGQLWLCGLLDGQSLAGIDLRDAGRAYAFGWFRRFPVQAPTIGKFEAISRTSGAGADRRDRGFERMDEALPLRSLERRALYEVLIHKYWGDGVAPWVERFVNERRAACKIEVAGPLPGAGDRMILAALLRGLLLIAEGARPARVWRAA